MDIEFELNPGEITVLPYLFKIWIQEEKNRESKYYQYWSLENLIKNEVDDRIQNLYDYRNSELWFIE